MSLTLVDVENYYLNWKRKKKKKEYKKASASKRLLLDAMKNYYNFISIQRPISMKKKIYERCDYNNSVWGQMLLDGKCKIPTTKEGIKIIRRFRVSFPKFVDLEKFSKDNNIRVNAKSGLPIGESDHFVSVFLYEKDFLTQQKYMI
jgi:hypothetical protein